MHVREVIDSQSGRRIVVRCWPVQPEVLWEQLKARKIKGARDLSWTLLSDDGTLQVMEEEQYGDSAERNLALSVFEHALDWRLGQAALRFMDAALRQGKLPRPFEVAASRSGKVFVIGNSGKVYPEPTKGEALAIG